MGKISFCFLLLIASSSVCANRWFPAEGAMPANALSVGRDTDGKRLFACRARFQGSLQPGKTWAGYGKCNIAYAGKELILDNFQVVTRPGSWSKAIISRSIPLGRDTDGKTLFLCRAAYRGSWQPGKTWVGYGKCNISYAGKELIISRYQVWGSARVATRCVLDGYGHRVCGVPIK